MSQTWQQACDCKGATATADGAPEGTYSTLRRYTAPVCVSCGTPWTPVQETAAPKGGFMGTTFWPDRRRC